MRPFKIFLLIIIFSTVILLINFITIFPWTPNKLVEMHNPQKADLIVVLGGDIEQRFIKAFKIAKAGYCNRIFCPTIRFPANNKILGKLQKENPNISFINSCGSNSTFSDAQITKKYIQNKNISSILLVTSDFHSFRALWIFKIILKGINIISVPIKTSFSTEFLAGKSQHHWAYRSEQKKFLFYYFRYLFY